MLAPGHSSPQATKYKNYLGLKITAYVGSEEDSGQKTQRDQKAQQPVLKTLEQAG